MTRSISTEAPSANEVHYASRHREALMLGAVLLVTLLVYLRCLGNGFVHDDRQLIVTNPLLGQWSFLWKSLFRDQYWFMDPQHQPVSLRYRPVLGVWFGLNYRLFGLNPLGWHAAMVGAHLVVVWLVYRIASRLSSDSRVGLLAALLFGLLPVHTEGVIWTAGFGLLMSAGFELAAFYLITQRAQSWRRNWALAIVLYGGALLSHETAVTFPGLVAAYVFFLEGTQSSGSNLKADSTTFWDRVRRSVVCAAPFVVEVVVYLFVRRLVLGAITGTLPNTLRLLTVPKVLLAYLLLLLIPWQADPVHRVLMARGYADFYLPLAAIAAIGGAAFVAVRNSPRRRLYLFCMAWITISMALLMDLGALKVDQFVHDAYLYLASFGWCLMLADLAVGMARRGVAAQRSVFGVIAVFSAVCVLIVWSVQPLWHDEVVLFTHGTARFPESPNYRFWLGQALVRRGDLAAAENQFQVALSMDPGGNEALFELGQVHYKLGRAREAEDEIARAIAMGYSARTGYTTLADFREAAGDLDGAEQDLQRLKNMYPEDGQALYRLGHVHARLGRTSEAASEIGKALELMPDAPVDAYVELAELYNAQGERARSEAVLKQMESMPGGGAAAGLALAQMEARAGDAAAAEKVLRDLSARYASDPRVWTMLGLLLAGHNQNDQALSAYQHALALAPNDVRPHFFAATALHAMGRDREALEQCRRTLAINPSYPGATELMAVIERDLERHPPAGS